MIYLSSTISLSHFSHCQYHSWSRKRNFKPNKKSIFYEPKPDTKQITQAQVTPVETESNDAHEGEWAIKEMEAEEIEGILSPTD